MIVLLSFRNKYSSSFFFYTLRKIVDVTVETLQSKFFLFCNKSGKFVYTFCKAWVDSINKSLFCLVVKKNKRHKLVRKNSCAQPTVISTKPKVNTKACRNVVFPFSPFSCLLYYFFLNCNTCTQHSFIRHR